jgi:hypothetical protein
MKPRQPLPPVFVNERARLEEHDRFIADARVLHNRRIICPDCYLPPAKCGCPDNGHRR